MRFLFALAVALLPCLAQGSPMVLSTGETGIGDGSLSQGFWGDTWTGNPANDHYITGFYDDLLAGPQTQRGFFTFYVPAFAGSITSATLSLRAYDIATPDGYETLGFFDVGTDPITLNTASSGVVNLAIFDDLGSGTQYGSFDVSVVDSDTILSIDLNAAAIQDIASARGGYFSIGTSILTLSGDGTDQYAFGRPAFIYPDETNLLVLDIVPEPSTSLLVATGLIALAVRRRRRE